MFLNPFRIVTLICVIVLLVTSYIFIFNGHYTILRIVSDSGSLPVVHSNPMIKIDEHTKKLVDGYSKWLRKYSKNQYPDAYDHYHVNYPCLYGENFLGTKVGDGPKWGCGVHLLKDNKECIVYSFGSNNNFEFEKSVNKILPNCKIFIFDPTVKRPKVPEQIKNVTKFNKYGVGGKNDKNGKYQLYTIKTIMEMNKHKHIDIFKMDVEGWEWPSFLGNNDPFPSMGQLYIEIHLNSLFKPEENGIRVNNETTFQRFGRLIKKFEDNNLRMYHMEHNVLSPKECAEFAFIQKDWDPKRQNYTA